MPTLHGRARNIASLINNNQGGGDKKAGFPPMIGRDSWTTVAYQGGKPVNCMTLGCMQTLRGKLACVSRPVGSSKVFNGYFHC
jgi:hypothetical protein